MYNWTDEQIEWMLDCDNEFYHFGIVSLMKATGKSIEEILKMRWEDIDCEIERKLRKYVHIYRLDERHGLMLRKEDGSPYTPEEFADAFNTYCISRDLDIRLEL